MTTESPPDVAAPTVFAAGSLVGAPVRRVEDPALLRGLGTFIDNLRLDRMAHVAFVRSPFAHALIRHVDTGAARGMPGVLGVYTATDLEVPSFGGMAQLKADVARPPLAQHKVRFVGDVVAVVVATTKQEAVDAAERVEVDYEPLAAVVDMEQALEPGAPIQFEELGTNLVLGSRAPSSSKPLDGADVVIRGRFENQRVAVVPMEGAAIAAVPGDDGAEHDLTVYLTCQMPHNARNQIARLMGIDPERVRLIAPHVGGSFGAKHLGSEGVIVLRLALELGRPVTWVETRSEDLVALPHGRGQVQYAEMGFRRDGTIVGAHYRVVGDAGAYAGFGGMLANGTTRNLCQGVYHVPQIAFDVAVAVTNTTPMGAYRGAGRPEAAALVERMMDLAADELGIDPVELRRHNLIRADEFPFDTVTGQTYDSGDYERALDEALRLADYDGLRAEQAERRRRGDRHQLGIGLAMYVEISGGGRVGGEEYAEVSVHADGTAIVKSGASAHGQGHATAFSALVADELGMPLDRIRVLQSDTALVPRGVGTGGSRSLQVGGSAVVEASRILLEGAKELAAELLEAAVEDITVVPGVGLSVAGAPDKAIEWARLASAASGRGVELRVEHDYVSEGATFPFGAHVSVVEVDMETGRVTPMRHVAVDDCGRIVNPLLVAGQVHGGLASGISQALWERFEYDADANPLTTTLADYPMPSAAELPSYELAHTVTPTPLNTLGAKGIGESATVGSTPAVQNAVVDALSHLGVRHLDMPCTPQRVWQAIQDARAGTLPDPWRDPPAIFETLPVLGGEGVDDEIDL